VLRDIRANDGGGYSLTVCPFRAYTLGQDWLTGLLGVITPEAMQNHLPSSGLRSYEDYMTDNVHGRPRTIIA
jgi:hypothetical protein